MCWVCHSRQGSGSPSLGDTWIQVTNAPIHVSASLRQSLANATIECVPFLTFFPALLSVGPTRRGKWEANNVCRPVTRAQQADFCVQNKLKTICPAACKTEFWNVALSDCCVVIYESLLAADGTLLALGLTPCLTACSWCTVVSRFVACPLWSVRKGQCTR